MKVGLGTGSTAAWMVRCLGDMVRNEGLSIKGVATSSRTATLAREVGVPIVTLDEVVATASDQMVVIADLTKQVDTLGAFPLPVEVIPFGWQTTKALIEETLVNLDVMGRSSTLRMNNDAPFITDEGNFILDLQLRRIGNARQLSLVLNQIPGLVENGLFVDICDVVVIGNVGLGDKKE